MQNYFGALFCKTSLMNIKNIELGITVRKLNGLVSDIDKNEKKIKNICHKDSIKVATAWTKTNAC